MPLYLSLPVRRPFRYSKRISGGRKHRSSGGQSATSLSPLLFWTLIAWWWYPLAFAVPLCWRMVKYSFVGVALLFRRRSGARSTANSSAPTSPTVGEGWQHLTASIASPHNTPRHSPRPPA